MARLSFLALCVLSFTIPSFVSASPFVSRDANTVAGNCGKPSDLIEVKSLGLASSALRPGGSFTVGIDANVKQTIKDGSIDFTFKVDGDTYKRRVDVCSPKGKCSIQSGDRKLQFKVPIPPELPAGKKFDVGMKGTSTQPKGSLFCVNFT